MIIIIGAGLSGLLIAYRLKKEGIPFKILEARNRIGGRINTLYSPNNPPIEMGATWFNSDHKYLTALLTELEMDYFEQYTDRTVYFQPTATAPTQSIPVPSQAPSYRISGGTSHLIDTLFDKLDENEVFLNQPVTHIEFHNNSVQVMAKETFEGHRVILALPPKLWAKRIQFTPPLPNHLVHIAKQTHTWMEDSIKVALTYKQPFWQQENQPATLFSHNGPIIELYDHSNHQRSKYALGGFINASFQNLTYAQRRAMVIQQVITVFGAKAEDFINYEECIWRDEVHTFESSETVLSPHQNNGNPIFSQSLMDDKLFISSSESALEFPGYMEGAVYSAHVIANKITEGYQSL